MAGLPKKLRKLLTKHEEDVEKVAQDLNKQRLDAEATSIPHPHADLLPQFVKNLTTGDTIVLATSNDLDALYHGDFLQLPVDVSNAPARKTKKVLDSNHANVDDKKKKKRRFRDFDKRETRWHVADHAKGALPGRGILLYKDGTSVLVHDFLGPDRTDLIHKLHDPQRVQKIARLPHMAQNANLHLWQEEGAYKTVTSCQGPVRGVLNASKMGTGKSRETLIALEYARTVARVPGSFDLILTPLSCIGQWVKEVEITFAPGRRPRIFILRDPSVTALELIQKDIDIVITTYAFLFRQAKKAKDFLRFIAAVNKSGREEATRQATEHRWPTKRPVTPLYSNIMRDRPHRHVVCDEVQLVKNPHGYQHAAVRNLFYNAIIMLSGTPFSNRLTGGYAYIDLLPSEPFQKFNDVLRIFANDSHHRHLDCLQPTVEARFLKYFLSFTYGNTNKDLNLPKVVEETVYFLLIWDIEAQVSNLVQRFVEKLMAANGNVLDLGTRTDESKKDIMLLATRARMLSWLNDFVPAPKERHLNNVKNMAARLRILFKEHVRQKQAENHARRKREEEGASEELTSEDPDAEPEEMPTWAAVDATYVKDLDRSLPQDPKAAASFMRSYVHWSRDPDAVAQKRRLAQELTARGVELPPAKVPPHKTAIPYGSATKIPETKPDHDEGEPSGTHSEPLTLSDAGNADDESSIQLEGEIEMDAKLDEQEILEDLSRDVPTALVDDELNQDYATEQTSARTLDKRAALRQRLRQKSFQELLCPRVKATLDTWQRIRHHFPNDHGLIWSQSVQFLDVVAEALSRPEYNKVSAIRFDGDCDDTDRAMAIDEFRSASCDRPMLTSTGSGGAGVNLAFANQVILCETLWNVQDEMQVIDRCHRQLQEKQVYVYRLFGSNSAVDLMIEISKEKKWAVIEPIMQQLIRTEGVQLQIPEISEWFVSIDVQSATESEDEGGEDEHCAAEIEVEEDDMAMDEDEMRTDPDQMARAEMDEDTAVGANDMEIL